MAKHKAARERGIRWLPFVLAVLVFVGMFARISMLARLSERGKRISALEAELSRGEKEISRKELLLSELYDLRRIALRAGELGMTSPEGDQIRVLRIETIEEPTSGLSIPGSCDTSAKRGP